MVARTVYENTAQRVAIFVDVQNMFYSAKTLHQSKIDYRKLLEEILKGRQLVRATAYVVQKADVDQSAFLEALRRSGYEVKGKELTIRDDGTSKGDWKVETEILSPSFGRWTLTAAARKSSPSSRARPTT